MKASVLRMGGTIASPERKIFILSLWMELYILGFIFLFLSDIMPFPPRSLTVYASIPLALLGIVNFQKASPTLRFLCVAFALSAAYQQIMDGEVFIKHDLAIFAVFFIITYYQQMGEEGLERLKNYIALFFILSFVLFLGTFVSDNVLKFRENLYSGVLSGRENRVWRMFLGKGGLASTRFFFSYQISAGICLLIGEIYKRGLNKSIFTLCLIAISALTLILGAERSPLVAVALALVVIGFIVGKPWKIIFMGLLLISLYYPMQLVIQGMAEPTHETAIQRVLDENKREGSIERILLQFWVLSEIPFYPLGIRGQGLAYETFIREGNFEDPMAPHNGYVTRPLSYGWFLLFIVIIVFYKVVKMVSVIKRKKFYTILPVLGGVIGAMANAFFHNASFLSFSPETVILLMLLGGYFDCNLKKGSQDPRRPNVLLNHAW
jgi:hypothetical protein